MPRKLVRRRIRRQFPRILYFSEVYDSSYGDPTGEEEWLAKLYGGRNYAVGKGDKFKWQGRVPRHPPARFIIVSIPCHTLTQFEGKKKKKKKKRGRKMYSVATVSNDMARDPTIYFRSRAFRTRWIDCLQDFVNEFHQLAPSACVRTREKMENRTRAWCTTTVGSSMNFFKRFLRCNFFI